MEFQGEINPSPRHYSAEATPSPSRSIRYFVHMIHSYVLPFFFLTLVTIPNFIGELYLSVSICDVGKPVTHTMYFIQGLGPQ